MENISEKPLVSIIIPIYNAEKTLERCLQSVCSQSYENIEIILMNDGSTDGSIRLCNLWAARDVKIRVYNQDNAGPAIARNNAIAKSKGEYLLFVDADDYISYDLVEKSMDKVLYFHCDMVIFGFCYEKDGTQKQHSFYLPDGYYAGEDCKNIAIRYIDDNTKSRIPVYSPIRMIKRAILENPPLRYDGQIKRSEDYLFWAQVQFKIKDLYLMGKEVLYHYVDNPTSITHNYVVDYWKMVKKIYTIMMTRLPTTKRIKKRIQNMLVQKALVSMHNSQSAKDDAVFKNEIAALFTDYDLKKACVEVGLWQGTHRSRLFCFLIITKQKSLLIKLFLRRFGCGVLS